MGEDGQASTYFWPSENTLEMIEGKDGNVLKLPLISSSAQYDFFPLAASSLDIIVYIRLGSGGSYFSLGIPVILREEKVISGARSRHAGERCPGMTTGRNQSHDPVSGCTHDTRKALTQESQKQIG